ncbi:MAG: A24 family peptidase [Planctomycetota bacterium]
MLELSDITDERMVIFQWGVVIGASLIAALGDLKEKRIPNALTFPVLVVGLIWSAWLGGFSGLAESAGTCALLALPYVMLFLFFGGGAGDAKLMGALGAWLGFRQGLVVLACVAIAGGIQGIAKAIARKRLKYVLTSLYVSLFGFLLPLVTNRKVKLAEVQTEVKQSDNLDIPYGVAIFAGVCAAGGIIWML